MARHTNKVDAASPPLHLVILGLSAIITIISFGLASSSWLSEVRGEKLVSSRIGEAGIEFLYPRSAVVPYAVNHAAPLATIADLPSSVRETAALPSARQNLATSVVPPVGPEPSSSFELPSDSETYPTVQQTWNAPSTQAVPIDKTLGASQESAPVSMPTPAKPLNASLTASPAAVPAEAIPQKERDLLLEAPGSLHPRAARFDEGAIATHQATPAQPVQHERANEHFLGSKAAFQHRVKKECGPIHDLQLRRDCIRSFSAYHR